MMTGRTAIVIGASAGGVDAIRFLVAGLPADFPAAVFIVLHIGAHRSQLPLLLNQAGPLRAVHPRDGDPILPGQIHIAPPDRHLVIEPGHVRLTKGPRENWARPAIDPLFRSAAGIYGSDAIGVVLTGGLNDGTAGLFEIKRNGGTAVVQDPADAAHPDMPRSALRHVRVDHCLPLAQLPDLLTRLVAEKEACPDQEPLSTTSQRKEMTAEYTLDQPVTIACPDCGGALRRTELGTLIQYGCHIGHVYTAEVMVAAQFAALERSLETSMRSLSERGELCRQMAERCHSAGDAPAATHWDAAVREARERAAALRRLLEKEWIHPDGLETLEP